MTNPFALDTPVAPPAAPPAPVQAAPAPAQPVAPSAAMDGDPFGDPAPQESKGPRLRDIYGRLVLLIPHKLEEGVPNRLSKEGGTQDRLTADVVVLDGGTIHYGGAPEKVPSIAHTKTSEVPYKRARMFISAAGIISQSRNALAQKVRTGQPGMVLGRLTVGEARGDNNPPWLLTPATDADKAVARAYLAQVDPFA